jgi:hypothetical protein
MKEHLSMEIEVADLSLRVRGDIQAAFAGISMPTEYGQRPGAWPF